MLAALVVVIPRTRFYYSVEGVRKIYSSRLSFVKLVTARTQKSAGSASPDANFQYVAGKRESLR